MRVLKTLFGVLLLAGLLIAPGPPVLAGSAEALAVSAFAGIANPCGPGETWIKPDRIVQLADGGTVDEYDKAGVIVRTPQAPAGFDPLTASDKDLATYGLPPRPDGLEDLKSWQEDMAAWRPTADLGECQTTKRATIEDNPIWSGYDADNASSTYYRAIQGDYVQPAKSATSCTPNEEVSWVGLGGYHTSKLMQTGTGIDTDGSKYAWYEYLNASGGIPITKMPSVEVHAGNGIHIYLVHQTSGAGQTTFYVYNKTNGTNKSKIIDLGNAYYDGYSAEFIDERPSYWNGYTYVPTNLTNFNEVNWTNAKVYKYDGTWHSLGSQTNVEFDMWNTAYTHYLAFPSVMSSNTTFTDNWIRCN